MNRTDALKILGLCDPASDADIKSAFRARVKDVHPDLNPTSDALLRLMIEARDILMQAPVADITTSYDRHIMTLTITPQQAIHGGDVICDVPVNLDLIQQDHTVHTLSHMRRIRIHLPKGLRTSEILELKEAPGSAFLIDVALDEDMTIAGNDIWISAEIEPHILRLGGSASIDTPYGPHVINVKGPVRPGSCLCLTGQGLPARGGFAVGDMHIRLTARSLPAEPAAELLSRFTQLWG